MEEDHIHHSSTGSVSFVGKDAVLVFSAFALASALRLYARTRMKPNRQWTPSEMLKAAGRRTGKTYQRGQYLLAAEDLEIWGREMRDALPHTMDRGEV